MTKINNKAKLLLALNKFKAKYDFEDTKIYGNMQEFAQYVDYGHNGIIGMTFEGGLYSVLNYGENVAIENELDEICDKYDVWYELGNAWNCAFYNK